YGDGVAAASCSYRPSAEVVDPNLSRSTTQCRPLRPPVSDRVEAWFWTRPRTEGGRRGTGTKARGHPTWGAGTGPVRARSNAVLAGMCRLDRIRRPEQ